MFGSITHRFITLFLFHDIINDLNKYTHTHTHTHTHTRTYTHLLFGLVCQGIQDYDDETMFNRTIAAPDKDLLPMDFLSSANTTLMFPPGEGGLYSGNGYVILGMVLSALSNASSWDKLDQFNVVGLRRKRYNSTLFMRGGKCSQYARVVHQYGMFYGIFPYTKQQRQGHAATGRAEQQQQEHGTGRSFSHFTPATSPLSPSPRVLPQDFGDLDDFSCLNGWTMGNIAVAPKDTALFYHDLANGKVVNQKSLSEMLDWKLFTGGNVDPPVGTPYGLGVFAQRLIFPVKEPEKCVKFNNTFCSCLPGGRTPVSNCKANISAWGA